MLPELAQGVDVSALLAAAASVEACCQDTEPWPLWPDARLQQFLCVLAHVSLCGRSAARPLQPSPLLPDAHLQQLLCDLARTSFCVGSFSVSHPAWGAAAAGLDAPMTCCVLAHLLLLLAPRG